MIAFRSCGELLGELWQYWPVSKHGNLWKQHLPQVVLFGLVGASAGISGWLVGAALQDNWVLSIVLAAASAAITGMAAGLRVTKRALAHRSIWGVALVLLGLQAILAGARDWFDYAQLTLMGGALVLQIGLVMLLPALWSLVARLLAGATRTAAVWSLTLSSSRKEFAQVVPALAMALLLGTFAANQGELWALAFAGLALALSIFLAGQTLAHTRSALVAAGANPTQAWAATAITVLAAVVVVAAPACASGWLLATAVSPTGAFGWQLATAV